MRTIINLLKYHLRGIMSRLVTDLVVNDAPLNCGDARERHYYHSATFMYYE